jgi:hypothetical protein
MVRRSWLVPVLASLIAVALLVAGVRAWRMVSQPICYVAGRLLCVVSPEHRLHPLRAELLWAASAVCALIAVGVGLCQWRRPTTAAPATI